MNQKLLQLVYLPILLIATAIFVAGEVVMWPFVYIKMFFHKLTMVWVYSKSYRMSRADKFAKFITYFVIGPFVIIFTTICDTFFFVQHCLKVDLQKIKHKIKSEQLSKSTLTLMRQYFTQQQEKIVEFKGVGSKIREGMGIFEMVQQVLFPFRDLLLKPPHRDDKSSTQMSVLQDGQGIYNAVQLGQRNKFEVDSWAEKRFEMHKQVSQFAILKDIVDQNC